MTSDSGVNSVEVPPPQPLSILRGTHPVFDSSGPIWDTSGFYSRCNDRTRAGTIVPSPPSPQSTVHQTLRRPLRRSTAREGVLLSLYETGGQEEDQI